MHAAQRHAQRVRRQAARVKGGVPLLRGHRVPIWHCSPYLYTFYGKVHVEYRTKDRVVIRRFTLWDPRHTVQYTCVKLTVPYS